MGQASRGGSEKLKVIGESRARLSSKIVRLIDFGRLLTGVFMSKPKILVDPQPRTMEMIFRPDAQRRLAEIADLTVFDTGRMPVEMVEKVLPESEILIGQTDLPRERLSRAPKLRTIFNVEGNFLPNIDYQYCFEHEIRVLIEIGRAHV